MKTIKNNYTSMKTAVKILAILFLVSCGNSGPVALKKKIDRKRTMISKIEQQITDLEAELATLDTVKKIDAQLVAVTDVKAEAFDHYIEVQGSLDGDNNVAVFPEAMGVIEEINVQVGQRVSKGQILARMNDAAVRESIKGLETGLELATTIFNKQKSLWEQNIGSEVQYLTAKNAKETLEAQFAATKKQLDMMHIKSPINGTVEESSIKIGQTASPQYPAFRVVNFGQLKVITEVAEAYAAKIKPGDEIIVYLPDIKKEYKARVNFASNYINQVNRTFRVEATLKESDPQMKANMVAIVKINDYKNENAIVLPMNLVQNDQNNTFIFVAEKSSEEYKVVKRKVTTGQVYNGLAEITSGLTPGDIIITQGYLDVEEGDYVRW
jgi:membrane fusion protein (multidrug efflux system)